MSLTFQSLKKSLIFTLYLVLILSSSSPLCAQSLRINGLVIDEDTEEPIPFCTLFFNGSKQGGITEVDGSFSLDYKTEFGDSLIASSMGYQDQGKLIAFKGQEELKLTFRLKASTYAMEVIEVKAGENPANEIVRRIIRNKDRNDREKLPSYEAEMYSKVELDLDNIDPKMKDAKLFRNMQFIFDNVDSTSDVKPFLPAYVSEQLYDLYFVQGAGRRKDVLKAQKVSGVDNQSVVDFIGMLHEKYNIYDNWIKILGKEFVSPFSNQALGYYEYYILDSTYIKGEFCHKLKFKPRRRGENTFYGDFWVTKDRSAIVLLNMRMSEEVNINLVERVIIYVDFDKQDSTWLPHKEKMVIDFSSDEKDRTMGIIGRTTMSYRNYQIGLPETRQRHKTLDPEDVDFEVVGAKSEAFWAENRHEALSKNESGVYKMIDTIQSIPLFKRYGDLIYFLGSGFKPFGDIEIGPYWDMFYINAADGYRVGMGLGTSNYFSRKIRFYGYAGYGFGDKEWKYRGIFQYIFNRHRWTEVGAYFHRDASFEARSTESLPTQSLFSGFLRRNVPQKMFYSLEGKVYGEKTWKRGIGARFTLLHRRLDPIGHDFMPQGGMNFRFLPNPADPSQIVETVKTTEIMLRLRWAYKERILKGNFTRTSLGSRYPIATVQYTQGIKGVLGSAYNYGRLQLNLRHWFYTSPIGWFEYDLEAGKVFSRQPLPYLLLENSAGNEAYFYNQAAFNSMNSFEFVSDAYVLARVEHHWDGFVFNHIPLLRKLRWREVFAFRGVWGILDERHAQANRLNHYNRSFHSHTEAGRDLSEGPYYGSFDQGPYMEVSAGVENIFRFFRVDALWRLSYLDNRDAQRFSVRVTLDFQF